MVLKKHHKIVIGSFSSIVLIYMIVSGVLLYSLFIKQTINHNALEKQIGDLKIDTQVKFNSLTETLIQTRSEVTSLGSELGTIGEEFSMLKASAGEDFSGIIEDVIKSVVTVKTDVGQGTGFIITESGYIVTNAHVLAGGSKIRVITYEQEVIEATFLGWHENLDIALMKIPGTYNALELEDSENIQVGEKVIAIGNPLGLQFSVTEGIVSGIHRPGANDLEAYIQTDAALNPGNSGGPLIDKAGKVIGINNFKLSGGESLGFALESNYIERAIQSIDQSIIIQLP